MKILKLGKPSPKKVNTQIKSKSHGKSVVQNNHAIRLELENAGFSAMASGSYVHSQVDRTKALAAAEGFKSVKRLGEPVWLAFEGDKGAYLAQGWRYLGKLEIDGKAFDCDAFPGSDITAYSSLKRVQKNLPGAKNIVIEVRAKGEARTISGVGLLDPKKNYGFVIDGTEVRNFELRSNKYNAGKVAKLVSCK